MPFSAFLYLYFVACFFMFTLIMYAHEKATVIFVIGNGIKTNRRDETVKIQHVKTAPNLNNLHMDEDRLVVKLKWVLGRFVKCHKCNASVILCFFSLRLTVLPL